MSGMFGFTEEEVDVVRASLLPIHAGEVELKLFLAQAKRTGLDPIARQIYMMERFNQKTQRHDFTIGTTIDGFRAVAERTGNYDGQQGPFWCGEDGDWKDVWLKNVPPAACKVGVLRKDFKEVMWGVATWKGYQQGQGQWINNGPNMLAKCAEMLGLRKTFPQNLSGIYGKEEFQELAGTENEQMVQSTPGLEKTLEEAKGAAQGKAAAGQDNEKSRRGRPPASSAKPEPKAGNTEGVSTPGADAKAPDASADQARAEEASKATEPTSAAAGEPAQSGAAVHTEAKPDPIVKPEDLGVLLAKGEANGIDEDALTRFILGTFADIKTPDDLLKMKQSQYDQTVAFIESSKKEAVSA